MLGFLPMRCSSTSKTATTVRRKVSFLRTSAAFWVWGVLVALEGLRVAKTWKGDPEPWRGMAPIESFQQWPITSADLLNCKILSKEPIASTSHNHPSYRSGAKSSCSLVATLLMKSCQDLQFPLLHKVMLHEQNQHCWKQLR